MVPLPTSAAAAISSIVAPLRPRLVKRSMAVDKICDRTALFLRSRRDSTVVIYDYSHNTMFPECQEELADQHSAPAVVLSGKARQEHPGMLRVRFEAGAKFSVQPDFFLASL